jgi:NAD(P)-dependent dehydrogenase (short-subunit alcohol dehydrogenase family)
MIDPPARRVAIVTGAAQGIGRAVAIGLLAHGFAVVAWDRDRAACADLAAMVGSTEQLLVLPLDVADEARVRQGHRQALARFSRIDLLVNNAGIAEPHAGPPERLALATWNRYLAVNLTGAFLCAKHAIPSLRRSRGSIINIASTRALQSEPDTEAYAATKGGLVALTHALAISLGPAIRVNCISPGWIAVDGWQKRPLRKQAELRPRDHQQHPAGRVGRPEDVAELVRYLASEQADFITGQNLIVDGGMTRKMIYES